MNGFTKIPNWFYQSPLFSASEKGMIGYLVSRGGAKKQCFPSMSTIACDMALSKSTVVSIVKRLEEKGVIQKENRFSETGAKTSNLYTVILPAQDCRAKV